MTDSGGSGAVDLLAERQDWVGMTIPGSDRPVDLVRLYLHQPSKASVSLVRFPVGWRRPETGHYSVAEEFVVLRGSITVSGVTHRPGGYALLPPGYRRVASSTPEGCLALAAFSGPPMWTADDSDTAFPASYGPASDASRGDDDSFPGSVSVARDGSAVVRGTVEILSLSHWSWRIMIDGDVTPVEGPTFLRRWD